MAYEIQQLRFDYHDLEPYISEGVLSRHHKLHHPYYTRQVNTALTNFPALNGKTIEELLRDLSGQPEATQLALANIAGGHANHQFQWKVLSPQSSAPTQALRDAIDRRFGSLAKFEHAFVETGLSHIGAGWLFLVTPKLASGEVELITLPNNGSVLTIGKPGILICDLWDHAYDSQYPADREGYLKGFLKVIDWDVCEERYNSFDSGKMHTK